MTEAVISGNGNESSWLKQRAALFNSTTHPTTNTPSTKAVDKELNELKNTGVVSLVWSNKFVKQDKPAVTEKRQSLTSFSSPQTQQQDYSTSRMSAPTAYNTNTTPEAKAGQQTAEIQQVTHELDPLLKSSLVSGLDSNCISDEPFAPTPSNTSLLAVSHTPVETGYSVVLGSSVSINSKDSASTQEKDAAATLWFQCETLKTQYAQIEARLKRANEDIELYKYQLDEAEKTISENQSAAADLAVKEKDAAAQIWFQCETLKTKYAQVNARLKLANEDVEFYKHRLEETEKNISENQQITAKLAIKEDELAALWFRFETLKTENAQIEARLKRANDDNDFYQRQIEEARKAIDNKNSLISYETALPTEHFIKPLESSPITFDSSETIFEPLTEFLIEISAKGAKPTSKSSVKSSVEQSIKNSEGAPIETITEPLIGPTEPNAEAENTASTTPSTRRSSDLLVDSFDTPLVEHAVNYIEPTLSLPIELSAELTRSVSPVSDTTSSLDNETNSLCFRCTTLEEQCSESNHLLNDANGQVDFYKSQLEQSYEASKSSIAAANKEREKESHNVRQLAKIIVKQDQLLNEYDLNLSHLTRLTNESAYLDETQVEMDNLRQELATVKNQKEQLESTAFSISAKLEMSYSQMKLMMAVSTQIQNEFENFKKRLDISFKDILDRKQAEHEAEVKVLEEKLNFAESERLLVPVKKDADDKHEKELSALQSQLGKLTEDIQEKESIVSELKSQIKLQRQSMDSQMIELNQSILDKDSLLIELMNSRTNGNRSLATPPQEFKEFKENIASEETASASDSSEPERITIEPLNQLHISQTHNLVYATEEDQESESSSVSYDTEEEDCTEQFEDHCDDQASQFNEESGNLQSLIRSAPSNMSSNISFDSVYEERIIDTEHLSYSSFYSQDERSISLISSTGSLSSEAIIANNNSEISLESTSSARFCFSEISHANWPMPPPSNPLPAIPDTGSTSNNDNSLCPPRRLRSQTIVYTDDPNMSAVFNSTRYPNESSRFEASTPVIPPRRDLFSNLSIIQQRINLDEKNKQQHTMWMDDPESEEDDLRSDAGMSISD